MSRGLIAYWPFDEGSGATALEQVSGEQHEIASFLRDSRFNNSQDPQWRRGVKEGALLCDGYSNYIEAPASLIGSPQGGLTLTAWVAPRAFEHGEEGKLSAIVNQHDREARTGFILGLYRHGAWSFQLGIGGQWVEAWSRQVRLPLYTWSHIAAVYNPQEGAVRLYLNGCEVASAATPGRGLTMDASDQPLRIGRHNDPFVLAEAFPLNMFSGLLDELKLYGQPLSSEELRMIYAEDAAPHGGQAPQLSFQDWKLDRELLTNDRHRPQYHLSPPAHWMNEPHAPFYYEGQYHLFYQHGPQGPYWHHIHWGHWVSEDLVHWRDLPPALAPGQGDLDPDGIWSGSAAFDQEGVPVLYYTAGNFSKKPDQYVGMARSRFTQDGDRDLVQWEKYPVPVLEQHEGIGAFGDFRDPFVWKEGKVWKLLIGSGTPDGRGGSVLAYVSTNMIDWEYRGPFYTSSPDKYPFLGTMWELPVLLPLGRDASEREKHVLLISPLGKGADVEVFYWIGGYDADAMRFEPDHEEPRLIDVGDFHFTGPSGFIDPKTGRAILFTIAQGERTPWLDYESGWAHTGGLPLELFLRSDGGLGIRPISELQSLRGLQLLAIEEMSPEQADEALTAVKGDMLELLLEVRLRAEGRAGLKIRCTPDGAEETFLYYDLDTQRLMVDRRKTTLDPDERSRGVQGGACSIEGDTLRMHLYLDRSLVELYVNERKNLTTRVYPSREDALGLSLCGDGIEKVLSLHVWEMRSCYDD